MDGLNLQRLNLRPIRPPSAIQVGLNHFRSFALGLAILGLAIIAAVLYVRQTVDEQVRGKIIQHLESRLEPLGYQTSLETARFLPGQGFLLQGLTIEDAHHRVLAIDRLVVLAQAGWSDLLLGQIAPRAIELTGAHVLIERDADGHWNLQSLLEEIARQPHPGARLIPVHCQDGTMELHLNGGQQTQSFILREFKVVACPQTDTAGRSTALEVRGSLNTSGIRQVEFQFNLDLVQQLWSAAIDASAAQIDSNQLSSLTRLAGEQVPLQSKFRGLIDLKCAARGSMTPLQLDDFLLDGRLADFELSDPGLPFSLRRGEASFHVSTAGIDVPNLRGRTDQGVIELQYHQQGLLNRQSWQLQGNCKRLPVDSRIFPRLPQSMKELYTKWAPAGLVDMSFDIRAVGDQIRPVVNANVIDASFEYEKFPYRIEHCVGNVNLNGDHCSLHLQALDENRIALIDGEFENPGPEFTGFVTIDVQGLIPIDAKLLRALEAQPPSDAIVNAFSPTGNIEFFGRIERTSREQAKAVHDYRVRLVDCSVRHDTFSYPFYRVNGELQITGDSVVVNGVTGVHGNGTVRCDGHWNNATGLELDFQARSVSLDDQLLAALPAYARSRWTELRPKGVVDLIHVNLKHPPQAPASQIEIDAELSGGRDDHQIPVSVQPVWFPYAINNLAGRVHLADGVVQLSSMRGEHGRGWLTFDGNGWYLGNDWEMRLENFFVGGLEPDEQLLVAIPEHMATFARKTRLAGIVNLSGTVVVRSGAEANRPLANSNRYVSTARSASAANWNSAELLWELRADFDNLYSDVGFELKNLCGSAYLNGRSQGDEVSCHGEVDVDSVMIANRQLSRIQGPIFIDQQKLQVGSMATTHPEQAPRSLVSDFCDGKLRVDGQLSLLDHNRFLMEAQLVGCNVASVCKEMLPTRKGITGTGSAQVRLTGDATGKHSWRGNGAMFLRNARIEVPLMTAVGQVVRDSEFDRTIFDESNVEFEIHGENIDFTGIEIIGTPISLIGNGRVNHNREIDLDFYTIIGRNRIQIPLLTDLYRAGSQQFLHINVDGNLDNPQTHKTVLPGLNEPLQQLMQDLENRNSASGMPPNWNAGD